MLETGRGKGLLIYGGSFNPIHIGHLRLAIETREYMRFFLDRVDFVPAACHPQKRDANLLPFKLRVELIRKAIEKLPFTSCNELEIERQGPSYTLDTLKEYRQRGERESLYFLLGSQDFSLLPEWHKGLEIVEHCNLVVAPRGEFSFHDFRRICESYWPSAQTDARAQMMLALDGGCCLKLDNDSRIFYLPVPWLEISASRIRSLWLAGLNIDFLIPERDIELLKREKHLVRNCWLETK